MEVPWIIGAPPATYEERFWGYVVVHKEPPLRYWTGKPEPGQWSMNPRRALVDAVAPWGVHAGVEQFAPGGRVVRVLLEDEDTMLPLRHWHRT